MRLLPEQFVACAFDLHQHIRRRYQSQRCRHLLVRAEGVPRAMNKQRGSVELGKVTGAKIGRFARWMQWIRQQ